MSQSPMALEVRDLRKRYGHQLALRGLNLTVQQGEFIALFGPNGAGKTTFIRILAQLLRPTSGEVRLMGVPLAELGPETRRQLGVISHQTFLYPNLTGRENLFFYGQLFDVPQLEARVEEVLAAVELSSRADGLVATFSKGMAQRLAIARAILHRPRLILLDEPYTGLDQHASALLTSLLRGLKDGERTFLMTTHHLEQGLELASRVCIQAGGQLVFDAPAAELTPSSLRDIYMERLDAAQRRGTR
ncbi:MAG: heme ABC exporter ATP-binding protein CcmA [Myxococcota bacterium]